MFSILRTVFNINILNTIILAFVPATRSVILRNQTVINKNFPIRDNVFFIVFKNSPKFEYQEFVSAIYAKRKFDPSSLTSV